MNKFINEDLTKAYKLIDQGKTALVCTKGINEKQYNITPIGWFTTYDYEPVTKVLFVSDPNHQCAKNIERTKEFSICIPKNENDEIINKCGSVSDKNIDKFAMFNIKGTKATKTDTFILPENAKAIIEFKLIKIIEESTVKIFMGEAIAAFKLKD